MSSAGAIIDGSQPVSYISMKERITNHQPKWTGTDFRELLSIGLSYKIVVRTHKYVTLYPDIFELGDSEYGVDVDCLLDHRLVGNVGSSEMTTVSRNSLFLSIFDNCLGFSVYRDQADISSVVRKRPDDTIVSNGAILLKNESKGDAINSTVAEEELTDKMGGEAAKVFPVNSQSIFGMTSFPEKIVIFSINHVLHGNDFTINRLQTFDMRQLNDRVSFIKCIFKMAEWMTTVPGPRARGFHLIWNCRRGTQNGHKIQWNKDGLLKELKHTRNFSSTMPIIEHIYSARFTNVEWGRVILPNKLQVTRIGFMLRVAISEGLITREKAIRDIETGWYLLQIKFLGPNYFLRSCGSA
jgi:hypothetical protein